MNRSRKHGFATLWTILALPVMVLLLAFGIEAGRLHLARRQLVTSLESAALSAAQTWCESDGSVGTLPARQAAVDFAMANDVLGNPVRLAENLNTTNTPNQNADCNGDLLFGTIFRRASETVLDAGMAAGCGNADGPNAHATHKVSTGGWQTVNLCGRSYDCMVVISTPQYDRNDPPAVVRIRNTGANSFEFFVQETNTGNALANVPVHFFIAEAGVYDVATHGVRMEVVKVGSSITDHASSWVAQEEAYRQPYTNPVVLGQVMTFNDPNWSVFWMHGGNRNIPPGARLFVGKHVGQDSNRIRSPEALGYVVIEEGAGMMNGLPFFAALGPDSVRGIRNSPPYTYATVSDIGSYAIATKAAEAGGNGAWALLYGDDPLRPGALDLALDEYRLTDRRHTTEPVSYLLFGGPCAVRARSEVAVSWLFSDFLGSSLGPTTITAEATAVYDCELRCARLIRVDRVICP